jgi:hypothetical protein
MEEKSIGGPYVQIAAICSTALVEQGGGSLSLIRIQDRIQLAGPTDKMQPQPLMGHSLVVVLKSGDTLGKYNLSVVPVTPSGQQLNPITMSALFEGQERGVQLVTPLPLVATEEGLYWFEISLESQLLTRVPLRVMYQKVQFPGMILPPGFGR